MKNKHYKINNTEFKTILWKNKKDVENIKITSKSENQPLIHLQTKEGIEFWHLDKSNVSGQDSKSFNKNSILKCGSVWIDPHATNVIPLPRDLRSNLDNVKGIVYGVKDEIDNADIDIKIDNDRKAYTVVSNKELWLLNAYLDVEKDKIKYLPKKNKN